MAEIKKGLELEDYRESMLQRDFTIRKLKNTVEWNIGDGLTTHEVKALIREGYNVTIKQRS